MRVKYQQLFSNECGKYAIKNLLNLYKIKGEIGRDYFRWRGGILQCLDLA